MDYYINIKEVFKNSESVISELECWINEKIDFLILWESIFNRTKIEYDDEEETYTIESWILNGTISFKMKDDDYYINPQILLAFVIDEPLYRINLITSIFSLPAEHVTKIINDVLI